MGLYNSIIIALSAIMGGTLITYLYDETTPTGVRICAGACIGFAGLGLIGFIWASFIGFSSLSLVLTTLTVATPLLVLTKPRTRVQVCTDIEAVIHSMRRSILRPDRRVFSYFIFYATIAVLLSFFFRGVMFQRIDGIHTSIQNNIGDLPFHLSIITGFVYGQNFPPEHPEFAGARLTYPFLTDFIAAIFVRAGATLQQSFFLENLVLALALVGLLHYWALKLTGDTIAALMTPVLVLFSGGLGWMSAARDLFESGHRVFATFMHLPRDYTVMWDGAYRWGNILNMLAMQRTLLLGLPLSLIVWTLWWQAIKAADPASADTPSQGETLQKPLGRHSMIAAGTVAGLLPFAHTYSFIVMMGMGACLALLFQRWQAWTAFFAVALLIAAPQVLLSARNSAMHTENFFGWHWGLFLAGNNFLWFWILNTGFSIPLLAIAVSWRGPTPPVPRSLLLFYLPFTLCFIVPNLIRLAPWRWDNLKVMVYWYIASAPLIALLLARLWRGKGMIRVAAPALLCLLALAGSLDVWRVISNASQQTIYDREAMAFADIIVKNTPARALILHVPNYNHAVFLTGRRSLIGGHLFSHGIDSTARVADVQRIFVGAADTDTLMERYGVKYVVTEPLETATLPFPKGSFVINERFFERYPLIATSGRYRLYAVVRSEKDYSAAALPETERANK